MIRTITQSIAVIVMMLPVISFAGTYSGGDGTQGNPYQIGTTGDWQELMAASADWDKHFILTADVNLAGITITPVGTGSSNSFTGVFDGNGHILRNAVISQAGSFGIGIFGYVGDGGQIRNLCVEDVNIRGSFYVGGLVGENQGSITSCSSSGSVSGNCYVGGLVGYNHGQSACITSCYSCGAVSGGGNVGGLVGDNRGGSITLCCSTGSVSGNQYVGGLVGSNSSGSITSCCSTGSVTGTDRVGGLVGDNYSYWGCITFCYSTGSVTGTGLYVGGFGGRNDYGSITSCFWDIQTSGQTTSAGGVGKTTAEMQTLATYLSAGWDFVGESTNGVHDFWRITANDYPRLVIADWTLSGGGTADSPYLVESVEDLARVWLRPQAYYRLNGNLDLSGISWSTAIIPYFAGVFDGQGFVIRNSVINQPGIDYVGIFGYVASGGQILNLGVEDVNITSRSYVGGLVGRNNGSITCCYSTGSVSGGGVIGGLAGCNNDGTITACYSTGSVTATGSNVGGLAGSNYGGSITFCYSTGAVSGTGDYVGGLVGGNVRHNEEGSITSCYSTGSVSGNQYVGGLVGQNWGSIASCYSAGSVTGTSYVGGLVGDNDGSITSCYSTGSVSASGYVGGLVGANEYGSITSCYSTGAVTGTGNDVGGLVGENYYGWITSCYSTGSVSGNWEVGGLVGYNGFGTITSCYSTGSVSGTGSRVGGLVGLNCDGSITFCYSTGSVSGTYWEVGGLVGANEYGSITSCYSTGSVSGTAAVGGLVGANEYGSITSCYSTGAVSGNKYVGGLVGSNFGTITSCFWDTETSGKIVGVGYGASAGVTGKLTADMMTQATFTNTGWDFSDTDGDAADWMMLREGEDYPRLAWQTVYPGDIAGLYGVNLVDYAEIAAHWGQTGCSTGCEDADVNGDGTVDFNDLMFLADNWLEGM